MTKLLPSRRGARVRRSAFAAVSAIVALALSGCAETHLGAQVAKSFARTGDDGGDAPAEAAARNISADPALAPEVFDATGLTIWDGASTLQGVWFAHPLAQRAQRVKVFNLENGLEVEGALFRRDPAISGPSILLSSDAARSLGITPGDPTELQVIALREGPAAPTTAVAAAPPETGLSETAVASGTAEERMTTAPGVETTALAAPGAEAASAEEPTPSITAGEASEDMGEAVTADAEGAEPASSPELMIEDDAEIGADDGLDDGAAPVLAATRTPEDDAPPAAEAAGSPTPQARPARVAATSPDAAPAARPETAEAAAPTTNGRLASGRYLQIGTFSVETNAIALVERLRARGQPAEYVVRPLNGAPHSIVVVGPLADAAALDAARAASAAEGQKQPLEVTL